MDIHSKIREGRQRLNLSEAAFGKLVGVSRAAVQQWERPDGTAPKLDRLQAVADALNITVAELLSPESLPPSDEAHVVSHLAPKIVPTIDWGDLMTAKLPHVFKIELTDNSMAPRAPAGAHVEFTRGLEPKPGDGVLVKDRSGHHYFREYKSSRVGVWSAHAYNPAYEALDSVEAGLSVVAVLTGMSMRWAI